MEKLWQLFWTEYITSSISVKQRINFSETAWTIPLDGTQSLFFLSKFHPTENRGHE